MYLFIVNPIAGNGRANRLYHQLISDKRLNSITYETVFTRYEGHALKIAKDYINKQKYHDKHWIVIGGDGTLHEVVKGIGNMSIILSFLPGGSGNDFARGINMPLKYDAFIETIFIKPYKKPFTLGKFNDKNFVNCVGIGFDAVVAHHTNHSPLKKGLNELKVGKLGYTYQLIKQLFAYKPIDVSLTVDNVAYEYKKCFLLTVNNQPYLGGGMKINPYAKNNDETYSCIIVNDISKLKVLFLFSTVFFGWHTRFKEVKFIKGKEFVIKTNKEVLFQADGETAKTNNLVIGESRVKIDVIGSREDGT